LKDDVPLLEQGFDSMDLPALAAAAEKWYGIDLSDADPTVLQTVNEFVAYLNGKLP
jgi:acyl carrier protein